MTIDLGNAVLLPVDMQRAFDRAPWPRRWNRGLDRNGLRLLEFFRKAGRPIIHVRHDSVEANSTLRPGLAGHAYRDGFGPRGDEAEVAKSVNSAFIGTDLDLRLRRLGVTQVVTFGVSTDMCVSTTVRNGANLGWRMVVVGDACDCFDLPDGGGGSLPAETVHAAHLATLRFEFCEVVSTRDLVAAVA